MRRNQESATLMAIAADPVRPTARGPGGVSLETVKPSWAYWILKALIGTAVANVFWILRSQRLSNRAGIPVKTSATNRGSKAGLALLSRGCAVDETRDTEIASASGMGSVAPNSSCCSAGANSKRYVEVFLRTSGQAVAASGFPAGPRRQVASHPCLVARRGARRRLMPSTVRNSDRRLPSSKHAVSILELWCSLDPCNVDC